MSEGNTPNAIYVRLGLAYQDDSTDDASETNLYNIQVYECMSNKEKQEFTLALWIGVDRNAQASGADVVGLLSEEELSCVMGDLSAEEMAAVASSTPLQAVTIANKVIHCIDPETNIEIFVKGLEWGLGDFSDEVGRVPKGIRQRAAGVHCTGPVRDREHDGNGPRMSSLRSPTLAWGSTIA